MLADEIERVGSVRPARLKFYGEINSEALHKTWLDYFPKAPRGGSRLFDESRIVRPFKKKQPLELCKRCNGHHQSKNSWRTPSCTNLGSNNYSVENCMAAAKCGNCGGPYRADK